jgi:hypothetical protein
MATINDSQLTDFLSTSLFAQHHNELTAAQKGAGVTKFFSVDIPNQNPSPVSSALARE